VIRSSVPVDRERAKCESLHALRDERRGRDEPVEEESDLVRGGHIENVLLEFEW